MFNINGTPYYYDRNINRLLSNIQGRISDLRTSGKLSRESLKHIYNYFKIKNIYHSNAIEGNMLDYGETRLVVEQGLTISGKPLKDSIEATNLSNALDFFMDIAGNSNEKIKISDIKQIHSLILKDINEEAGMFRDSDVEISGSNFTPPSFLQIQSEIDNFSKWLDNIEFNDYSINPIILSAIAHAWFVYIHPFIDGNGRTARIIMNLILIKIGYPIAIITKDDRIRYYDALENTQSSDLTAFISLITDSVDESLEEYYKAAYDQREKDEWARLLMDKVNSREDMKIKNEFEIWRSSMNLLQGYVRNLTESINDASDSKSIKIHFNHYDIIELEKYILLKQKRQPKGRGFFKITILYNGIDRRYLFFFGFSSITLSNHTGNSVTVHVAYETDPFHYEKIEHLNIPLLPDLIEIGYSTNDEDFICRFKDGTISHLKVESFGKDFIRKAIEHAISM